MPTRHSFQSYLLVMIQLLCLGGIVITGKMPIPGVGWSVYCLDSEGNTFGLFENDESAGK